MIKECR